MKINRLMWILVAVVMSVTAAIVIETPNGYGQESCSAQAQPMPETVTNIFNNLNKYPSVDYEATESFANELERRERTVKNTRYDSNMPVSKHPDPDTGGVGSVDGVPLPPALPFKESKLVVIGEITSSRAFLANEKKGIYSEFSVRIQTLLKENSSVKLQTGSIISADRGGGVVRYSNGQKLLYIQDWQNLPEAGRYILFLSTDDVANPNYKILTAYRSDNNKITSLDGPSRFRAFNGMNEEDFIDLVVKKKSV